VVAGVDGFRGRWVIALVDGRTLSFTVADGAAAVLAATAHCTAVAVDVPMGLADDGVRPCEPLARKRLAGASSSVFPTPARAVLEATDYLDANVRSVTAAGKKISKQTWFIVPGIRDFDSVAVDPARVVESHPELTFRAMDTGTAFASKKSARGQGQRMAALGRWLDIARSLGDLPDGPAMDDVLDAVACAWTARRWADGVAQVLGGELDGLGKPMRIVL
jgi:predicted RNase H-like nuclease